MEPKILLITVYHGGYGKTLTDAALKRGDAVIAVAQDMTLLEDLSERYGSSLFPIQTNFNDRKAAFDGIDQALQLFGQVDAVIDAGFNITDEEGTVTGNQLKSLLENEMLGLPWLPQAVLPVLQRQRSGHYIQVSSTSRIVLPAFGHSREPKNGDRSLLEQVAEEIHRQGIRVSFVYPYKDDGLIADEAAQYRLEEVPGSTHDISYKRFRTSNRHSFFVAQMLLNIVDSTSSFSVTNGKRRC